MARITYTESGGQGNPPFDTSHAIAVMLEKHGIVCDLMHGYDWDWWSGAPTHRFVDCASDADSCSLPAWSTWILN